MSPSPSRGRSSHSSESDLDSCELRKRPVGSLCLPPEPFRLGPCTLLETLGAGGAGTVYRARLEEEREYGAIGSIVAVKVLDPERIESNTVFQRFLREVSLGTSVHHPAIVRTFESGFEAPEGNEEGYHYLVMELVQGKTLRQLMSDLGNFEVERVRTLALRIADGLDAIHSAGAAHRDLKPANVFVTTEDQIKLMDLGVAYLMQESTRLTREGYFVGTLLYASPEQIHGQPVGPQADLYSLGVVLYEAATGVQPFEAQTTHGIVQRHLRHVPPRAGALNPQLPRWLEEVIARLLEKEPKHRFATAAELREVLREGELSDWWQRRRRLFEHEVPRTLPTLPVERLAPFVGRYRELQTLRTLYRDARGGRGRALLLVGEDGAGKTRLLDELISQIAAEKDPATVLYGSYKLRSPGTAATEPLTTARGFAQGVLHFLLPSSLELASAEQQCGRLEQQLSRYLSALPRLVPGFVDLLAGGEPANEADPESAEAGKLSRASIQAVYAYLASVLAAQQTVVWFVEDLHLASEIDHEVFAALAQQCAESSILLVGTLRPGPDVPPLQTFGDDRYLSTLAVGRLSPRQVQQMFEGVLGSAPSAEELSHQLTERCNGNPYFLLEMIRHLEDQGQLRRNPQSHSLELAKPLQAETVPATIRELLRRRLLHLSTDDRQLLEIAAVQGLSCSPLLLATLDRGESSPRTTDGVEALSKQLRRLERETGLVHEEEGSFHFDHLLLQEMIYGELSLPQRAQLHGDLARAAELLATAAQISPDGETAASIACHYLRAGLPALTLPYLASALDHLAATYQQRTLLELVEGTLAVLGNGAPELHGSPELRCHARIHQSRCLQLQGRWAEAEEAAKDALAAARAADSPRWLALAQLSLGRVRGALEDHRGAYSLLEAAGDSARLAADPALEADAWGAQGLTLAAGGNLDTSNQCFRRQRDLAQQLEDSRIAGSAYTGLARNLLDRGEWQECLAMCDQGLEHLEGSKSLTTTARTLVIRGKALEGLGRWPEAVAALESALIAARRSGYSEGTTRAQLALACLALGEGRLESCRQTLQSTLGLCRNRQLEALEGSTLRFLGHAARAAGDLDDAERYYTEALSVEHRHGGCRGIARSAFALGRLLLELGDPYGAEPLLTEAVELAELYQLARPSVLSNLYLTALGNPVKTTAVDDLQRLTPIAKAEGYLLLWSLGTAADGLRQAQRCLDHSTPHLKGERRKLFDAHQPVARTLRQLASEDPGAKRASGSYLRIAHHSRTASHG
ncbi:MAG: protein kinase [Acidobacteriota bacterium]